MIDMFSTCHKFIMVEIGRHDLLEKLFETSHCKVIELLYGSIHKKLTSNFHTMWNHHPFLMEEEVETPTKFSKREGLADSQFLEGCCWERVGDLFHEGLLFLH